MEYFSAKLAAIAAMVLLPNVLLAFGMNLPKHQLKQYGKSAVHGYDVNGEVAIFFQGDTTRLNDYLTEVAKARHGTRKVTLHVGHVEIRSPWDKGPARENHTADWNSDVTRPGENGCDINVHVWLGRNVHLADLQIPANFTVASGGEISDFINEQKQRGQQQK